MPENKSKFRFPRFNTSKPTPVAPEPLLVPLGRVITSYEESKIAESSSALAKVLFGRHMTKLPGWWREADACGVVSERLQNFCDTGNSFVQLEPGWGYAVAQEIDASFFVVETAALEQGAWAGTLEPGGEHLFDELLAMVKDAQRNLVTPVLIESTIPDSEAPRSFSITSTLTRLRKAIPGNIREIDKFSRDAFSPPFSPFIQTLIRYEAEKITHGQ